MMATTGSRSYSTQCNFYVGLKRSKATQTAPTPRNSIALQVHLQRSAGNPRFQCTSATQTRPTNLSSTSTQCCLGFRIIQEVSDSFAQTDSEVTNDNFHTALPGVLARALSVLQSFRGSLLQEICRNSRGEMCIIFKPRGIIGLANEDLFPVQLVLTEWGTCSVHVLFRPTMKYNVMLEGTFDEQLFLSIMQPILVREYAFCPGLTIKPERKKIDIARVSTFSTPFERRQHTNCPVWYKKMPSLSARDEKVVRCLYCRAADRSVSLKIKRKLRETPTQEAKRVRSDSNFSIGRLSPDSLRKRIANIKQDNRRMKHRVTKLEAQLLRKDTLLKESQPVELQSITDILSTELKDSLEETLQQHDTKGTTLSRIWERDSELRRKKDTVNFFEDQRMFINGKCGNRWSSITFRMALAVFCRSRAAYEALRSFKILQLPSTSTLLNKTRKLND